MKFNQKGLDLLKSFEGCSLRAYRDVRGLLTIGYGCRHAPLVEGMEITQVEADKRLLGDVYATEITIKAVLDALLNENQYSALVCLVYNIGGGNFVRSELLKKLNKDNFEEASHEFLRWNHADGKVIDGLTRRREAERDLFLAPV